MTEYYKTPSSVIVLLLKKDGGETYVLCQKRKNTGFADGLWDFSCSGKVEEGETMREAAVREAGEELGITINPDNLRFAALGHKRDKGCGLTFYKAYFTLTVYEGEPSICESEKCAELKWFALSDLPSDIMEEDKVAAATFLRGEHYFEYGW